MLSLTPSMTVVVVVMMMMMMMMMMHDDDDVMVTEQGIRDKGRRRLVSSFLLVNQLLPSSPYLPTYLPTYLQCALKLTFFNADWRTSQSRSIFLDTTNQDIIRLFSNLALLQRVLDGTSEEVCEGRVIIGLEVVVDQIDIDRTGRRRLCVCVCVFGG